MKLYPHQQKNIESLVAILRRQGGALDASSTGTGKTFSFLAMCKALGARPAIVTRKAIIPSWEDACRVIGVEPVFIANYEKLLTDGFPFCSSERVTSEKQKFTKSGELETVETSTRKFKGWNISEPRTIFAFDEAQALRKASSFASRAAIDARRHFKTVLLSATPFSTPLEAEPIGLITGLFPFGKDGYYRWLFNHGCRKSQFGYMEFIGDVKDRKGTVPGTNAEKGRQVMVNIHADLFPARGVRTSHEEIPDFPKTQILVEAVETGHADEITKHYLAELEDRKRLDLERASVDVDPEFHDLVEVLPIVRDIRHRQEAELLMCEAITELAKDNIKKGFSVAVFVNFDDSITALSKMLKCKDVIRGDQNGQSGNNSYRGLLVKNFQHNHTNLVLVNIAAGGAGLSLHDPITQKPRVCLIVPPYSAVQLKQVLGRPHRLKGGFSQQKLLFAAGTVQEKVMKKVRLRMSNIDALTDADLDPLSVTE